MFEENYPKVRPGMNALAAGIPMNHESPVRVSLNLLHDQLGSLEDALKRLVDRLDPVCHWEAKESDTGGLNLPPTGSHVFQSINEAAARTQMLQARVRELLGALQV